MNNMSLFNQKTDIKEFILFRIIFNGKDVIYDDYFSTVLTHARRCYTFNSEEVIKNMGRTFSNRPGPHFGLQLGAYIRQDDFWSGADSAGLQVIYSIHVLTLCCTIVVL